MDDRDAIIAAVKASENFISEIRYIGRGGYAVDDQPRLYKNLEHDVVRVVFPTTVTEVADGTIVGMVCLYDRKNQYNIYTHTLCAGPGTNILLRAFDSPMPQASPQPQPLGNKAIRQFVAWKEAAWVKFLNDELELGTESASRLWLANFWKALDRMFGYGYLMGFDPDAVRREHSMRE